MAIFGTRPQAIAAYGLALAALGMAGAVVAYLLMQPEAPFMDLPVDPSAPAAPSIAPAASSTATSGATAAPAPAPIAPTFDIVRVGPQGSAVIAGRAAPGAQVVVRDGGQDIGQAKANSSGEWLLLPDKPLAPGGRELTVASRGPQEAETSGDTVLLSIPTPSATAVPVSALLLPKGGGSRLLQDPPPRSAPPVLALYAVDYDDHGTIRFAGTAQPGASVRVYVDNAPAGDATADASGRWMLSPQAAVIAGVHRLRVDQLTAAGRVQARVELPFQQTSLPAADLAADLARGRIVVQPGQNLWRLARQAYGSGVRYTVIYLANREQIRDPRLIYAGQTFATPGATPGAAP